MQTYTRYAKTFGTVVETAIYRENPVTGEEYEIELTVCGSVLPYDPGVCSGPAERCYPPEGGYVEDVTAFFKRHGVWTVYDLTDTEVEKLSEELTEACSDDFEPDEPDYDYEPDYDRDCDRYDY